jgi:hypothetical protein
MGAVPILRAVSIFRVVVAVCISLMITGSVVFAVDTEVTRQTLKELQGVYVIVEDIQPNMQRYAVKFGLTNEQLQKDIELWLKEKGIKVLSRNEWVKTPGKPVLYVNVNTHETEKYWYAYDIKTELQQVVQMEANPKIKTLATTWSMNMTGMANIGNLHVIKGDVGVLVGKFVEAYKAVNKK